MSNNPTGKSRLTQRVFPLPLKRVWHCEAVLAFIIFAAGGFEHAAGQNSYFGVPSASGTQAGQAPPATPSATPAPPQPVQTPPSKSDNVLPPLGLAGDSGNSGGLELLAPAQRGNWKTSDATGKWEFGSKGLTGTGDSRISYKLQLSPPWRLKFDIVVNLGMRPRLFFDQFVFANEAYEHTFRLNPDHPNQKLYPYNLGTKYHIQIDATRDKVTLHINGVKVDAEPVGPGKIEELIFSGGDSFSKGSATFSNIILTQGAGEN